MGAFTFVLGFETQVKTDESVAPQDIHGEKLSDEQNIVKFKRSDSCSSTLHKNWENHERRLR